jgi:hypothetical protein
MGEKKGKFFYAALSQPHFLTHSAKGQETLCVVSTWMGDHKEKLHFFYQQT